MGAQSILNSGKLSEWGEGMGPAVAGSRGSLPGSYMVVEARLVSSCLSLPSRARPRFSRLAESVGVTEYVLEKVELATTFSLEGVREESSEPAPAWWVLSITPGTWAEPDPPALPFLCSCLVLFPPFVPLYNHFFFLSSAFAAALLVLRGTEAAAGLRDAKQGEEAARGSCAPSPRDIPSRHQLVLGGHIVHSLPSSLLPLYLLF